MEGDNGYFDISPRHITRLLLIFTSIGEAFVSGIKENEKAERR
jgi:hypothetical protein